MFEWEGGEGGLRRWGGRSTVEVVSWVLFPAPQAAQGNGNLRGFYHLISQLLAVTTTSAFSSVLFGKSSVLLLSCSWFIGCLRENEVVDGVITSCLIAREAELNLHWVGMSL